LSQGGHLASIHSQADVDAIEAIRLQKLDTWIGFNDIAREAGCTGDGNSANDYATGFVWTDGTATDYTNWDTGEPNDWYGGAANCDGLTDGTGEDCSTIGPDVLWNDVNCEATKPQYACGMLAPVPPITNTKGRSSALNLLHSGSISYGGFCMGAQGAQQPRTALLGPGRAALAAACASGRCPLALGRSAPGVLTQGEQRAETLWQPARPLRPRDSTGFPPASR
jgi:hypothetical protein